MTQLDTLAQDKFNRDLADLEQPEVYKLLLDLIAKKVDQMPLFSGKKKIYYFSAEFLIGKLLSNNLLNLGIYDQVKAELDQAGFNIEEIEDEENEPSLGNGGLGRLAACFIDSIASLGLPGDGVGLNYHFGLFQQYFEDNQQQYRPDTWLDQENFLKKSDKHFQVPFKDFTLTSSLYDIAVLGYQQDKHNRLRLFDLDTVDSSIIEDGSISFDKTDIEKNLTLFLYPDDSDADGEKLRIYQQYFMVSNGAQLLIQEAIERGSNIHDLADYAVVQINDTHPTLIIPELIRLLTTDHGLDFMEAVKITSQMVAFTNHTILAEALETWPMNYLESVSPEIADIIRKLDSIIKESYPNQASVQIIDENDTAHMASIAIHFGFSTNGVSQLHTDILKQSTLKDFYELYPDEFHGLTNGITFRRWLMDANPELSALLDRVIGEEWRQDSDLSELMNYQEDDQVLSEFSQVKHANKEALAHFLQDHQGVSINTDSIVDVQVKRIHEYKRQQMLALYIIHKYHDIKAGNKPETPITIIFGGKAAPAYTIAQDIIHLILSLSELIANDPEVSDYLQVVFVENYNVTAARYLFTAADISEQISLASKEASGTGNMKFMVNGAVTLMTLDGANVEIADRVGQDNVYIFGKEAQEIVRLYDEEDYVARDYYEQAAIKPLVDFIVSDELLAIGNSERLNRLHQDMINKDYFMALIDLEEFIAIKEKMYADYQDEKAWRKKGLINTAQAGFFSSDRVINEYNDQIWHVQVDD
ncbi:glycogen/starch/alpha-glucan family phosphorylase [Aerococcus kribbianus]|uniref:Alpha-1,4 glucan phosphorylase n=1 Tax=Aerococcus kribbianus TaxID=2999064 RepID=A0A9X3FLU1_9LACT|nr:MULTISPECIES: glycogen/starch/alpha-glucan family phosphorylase [unclassified Aerococcus]MCZ0716865.1 glycogen/starch/alpha-glucan family phosphorylase [Aerococcus sp. YH-aer221]MCZ0725153.1 glycogen/starch/alpha-glucan family phosphorylase [Aerococcus sp. YH-aer222]